MKALRYFSLYFILVSPFFLHAQGGFSNNGGNNGVGNNGGNNGVGNNGSVSIPNPLGDLTLMGFFQTLLNVVMIFAVPLIVFFIIYAGFKYVTAQGSPEKISEAHKALLYALIGGLLILGANVLIEVIKGTVDSIAS